MSLIIAPLNVDLRIIKISCDDKLKKHFESLGLSINSTVKVIDNVNGNIVIIVKGVRLAVDRDIARRIIVA